MGSWRNLLAWRRELLNANSSTTMWQMLHDHIRPIASRFFSHHQAKPKNAQQHGKQNQLLPPTAQAISCQFSHLFVSAANVFFIHVLETLC